jgi:hypothetical protein
MRTSSHEFKEFININIGDGYRRNSPRAGHSSNVKDKSPSPDDIERNWENYLERMSKDGVYGDNLTLKAFVMAYGVDLQVFTKDGDYKINFENDKVAEKNVMIAYHVSTSLELKLKLNLINIDEFDVTNFSQDIAEHYSSVIQSAGLDSAAKSAATMTTITTSASKMASKCPKETDSWGSRLTVSQPISKRSVIKRKNPHDELAFLDEPIKANDFSKSYEHTRGLAQRAADEFVVDNCPAKRQKITKTVSGASKTPTKVTLQKSKKKVKVIEVPVKPVVQQSQSARPMKKVVEYTEKVVRGSLFPGAPKPSIAVVRKIKTIKYEPVKTICTKVLATKLDETQLALPPKTAVSKASTKPVKIRPRPTRHYRSTLSQRKESLKPALRKCHLRTSNTRTYDANAKGENVVSLTPRVGTSGPKFSVDDIKRMPAGLERQKAENSLRLEARVAKIRARSTRTILL